MATAYIGLGSNLGDRMATLRTAVQRLESLGRHQRGLESLRDGAGRIPGATCLPERGRRAGHRTGSRRSPPCAARHRARPGSHALLPKRSAHDRSRSAPGRRRDPRNHRNDLAAPAPARARLRPCPARGDCPGDGASSVWTDNAAAPQRAAGPGWCRGPCTRRLGVCAEPGGVARSHSAKRRRNVSGSLRKSRVRATCSRSSQATRRGVPPSRL